MRDPPLAWRGCRSTFRWRSRRRWRSAPSRRMMGPRAKISRDAHMTRVLHRSGAIPPIAARGEGIYLYTEDGRAIIDASGGAAVACLGHGNRRVADAVARQVGTMAYAHTGTFSNQPA